jgi:hypothetical protein
MNVSDEDLQNIYQLILDALELRAEGTCLVAHATLWVAV